MDVEDITIGDRIFSVATDDTYLKKMGPVFEPKTIQIFQRFTRKHFRVLDVGANIGLTCLFFGANASRVLGVEAMPSTFKLLQNNISRSGLDNILVKNVAASDHIGSVTMTYSPFDRSGGFVADRLDVGEFGKSETISCNLLDNVFRDALDRVDLIKFDIEGHEQRALEGAKNILQQFKPVVILELNHWCLNAFQRTSIPDHFDYLRSIFPYCIAISSTDGSFKDIHDTKTAYEVMYGHIVQGNYQTLVGSFEPVQG